jgi:predicted RNase H-like nuclease
MGVDACDRGWVGVVLDGAAVRAYAAATIETLAASAQADGALDVVVVDMPIGLPDSGVRDADVLARRSLHGSTSSVFGVPVRRALAAAEYATAVAVNRELTGVGISKQSYALREKIHEVERWLRGSRCRVVEGHPEVTFRRLSGGRRLSRKKSWTGVHERKALLEDAGIHLPADAGVAGVVAGVDDVLDAGAMAWTAVRYARREAVPLPDPPQVFSDGLNSAIRV